MIHALDGEQDMRKMGGLKAYLPTTYWTYLIATLAIAGRAAHRWLFLKGFYPVASLRSPHGSTELWFIGWITAGMTAFYMFRQLFMVFHGEFRGNEHAKAHIHESPPVMTLPLVVLAVGSIFAGWLGTPDYLWGNRWDQWLQPIFGGAHEAAHGALAEEIDLMLLTFAIGGLGFVSRLLSPTAGKVSCPIKSLPWPAARSTVSCSTITILMGSMTSLSCVPLPPFLDGGSVFRPRELSMVSSTLSLKEPEVSA